MFGARGDQRCDHQSLTQVGTSALLFLQNTQIHRAGIKAEHSVQHCLNGNRTSNKPPYDLLSKCNNKLYYIKIVQASSQLTALYSRNMSLNAMKSVNVSSMSKMSPATSSLCCLHMKQRSRWIKPTFGLLDWTGCPQ